VTASLLAIAAFGLSALLTWAMRRYALARGLVDVPNSRSSHQLPTPRGGGVAIVVTFLLLVASLTALGRLPATTSIAVLSAGSITAAIGFWDDHASLPARWRLAAHFLAATLALGILGGMAELQVFGVHLAGWPANLLGALIIVWLLNLYNFMDGIDGIAGVEAVTVCAGGAAIALVAGYPAGALMCLLLGAACAGFLVWNFPPARIFMGDAGSGFLGVLFGVLAIDAARHEPVLLWCWLILLGAFIIDATITLLRRLLRGERVYQAHRSHAYQHAARVWGAHRPVTVAFGLINLLWLLPWALMVANGSIRSEIALAIAWLPLIVLALRWNAGLPETAAGSPDA
jgi:Fuc2NAc and GlcNAc transferase